MKYLSMMLCLFVFSSNFAIASGETTTAAKKDEHEHEHQDEREHEDEHGHGESEAGEEAANVGPDKGITEVNEHLGFKLSPEAFKNFELKFHQLAGAGPWTIPSRAVLQSGEEVNVFRVRDGFFKRIDFQTTKKTQDQLIVKSHELKAGDEIVVSGLGFLRIAELAASGGVSHGHSH